MMLRCLVVTCLATVSALAIAQGSSPAGQCTEEFVQDYVLDDSATYASITPCPDADLNAAPAWPVRRDEIHKEYSRAELYMMPIEATVPVGDKPITGRTTRLDLGAKESLVHRSSWIMP
jgi:hypothetical protein